MSTLEAADAPFRITAPIDHITKLDDGTVLAHCVVTSEAPDSQGEIVDYDAFKAAAPDLMKWATLGEMHDPGRMDAGTILKLYFNDDARKVEADLHVVDPVAVRKVLSRTYKSVSIGGVKLGTRLVDVAGKTYRKITRMIAEEISLVNRGANPDAAISKQFVIAKKADMEDAGVPSPIGEVVTEKSETRTAAQVAIDETRAKLTKAVLTLPDGMSLNQLSSMLTVALRAGGFGDESCWVQDVFPDYLIYSGTGGAQFRINWGLTGGKATVSGTPIEVTEDRSYEPVAKAKKELAKVKKTAKAAAEAADTEEPSFHSPARSPP